MGRILMAAALVCVACIGGCRQEDRAGDAASPPAVEESGSAAELSDDQKAAIQAINATGGEIQTDDAGLPTSIDLASERVFADEALVRAALAFPNLKHLRLALSSVPPETLSKLATLTGLEELFLQDADLDDTGLKDILGAMPGLQRLTLRRLNRVGDEALDAVAACPHLEVLALIEMNQVTGSGLERLVRCANLRSLDLRNCGRLATGDFKALAAMKGLVEVKFGGPAVNDELADVIVTLPKVQSITVEDAQISGDFLLKLASHAATAKQLRTLAFARCFGVTDEALASIARFPNLEALVLRDIMITGSFLTELRDGNKPLPLKTLVAVNAFLDDETVAALPKVAPNLIRLDLRGNTGLNETARQALKKLQNLKDLKLDQES